MGGVCKMKRHEVDVGKNGFMVKVIRGTSWSESSFQGTSVVGFFTKKWHSR